MRLQTTKVFNNTYNGVDVFDEKINLDFHLFVDDDLDFKQIIKDIHTDIENSEFNYVNDVNKTIKRRVKKSDINELFRFLVDTKKYKTMDLFLSLLYYFDLEVNKLLKLLSNFYKKDIIQQISKQLTPINIYH